ncbi:MAG TPA: D-alanyl-D-alanine carboxypeptidase family protein [Candidatus Limnocylindrales bacterium]
MTAVACSAAMSSLRPQSAAAAHVAGASNGTVPMDSVHLLAFLPGTPPAATPTPDGLPAVSNVEPPPQCTLGDQLTPLTGQADWPLTGQADWPLTLVDSDIMVPADYVPDDFVGSDAAGFSPFFQVRAVRFRIFGEWAMPLPRPARPWEWRPPIAARTRRFGRSAIGSTSWAISTAISSSARPGHSEHQLGLAIDFQSAGGPEPWTYYNFATDTAAGVWLNANAWKYGFIMSYPYGSTPKSCYGFEPWRYRYVGVAEAAAIHASRQTTREWMWHHQPNPESLSPVPTLLLPTVAPGAPGPSAGPDASATLPPQPTEDWPAP